MAKIILFLMLFSNNILFSQAKITFDTLVYDLGFITEGGENVRKNIYFTNTGDEKLIITRAATHDGGSMATFDSEPILPGKKGKITFIYNSKRLGSFNRSVYVQSNGSNDVNLTVKGQVIWRKTTVSVLKKEIDLGKIEFDSIKSFRFELTNSGNENLHISFDSYHYPEIDLLMLKLSAEDTSNLCQNYDRLIKPKTKLFVEGELINSYGNAGDFARKLVFTYNSNDTLILTLKGKFIGKPAQSKIVRNSKYGKNCYYYLNGELQKTENRDSNNNLTEEYIFEKGNCISRNFYSRENHKKEREFLFQNGLFLNENKLDLLKY